MSRQAHPRKTTWTGAVREQLGSRLPLEHLLPERQPAYIGSWVYVFGVAAISSLIAVISSGMVLSFFGPQWWHVSRLGHFVNSMHFWSVQLFFIFTVLHLWGQFFMASWRDGRAGTWMIGGLVFAVSILTAFTGYLSQQNFDSQWIGVSAKDAFNSTGIGSFFNPLNFGQMYGLHVLLAPGAVVALVVIHVVMVRIKGVVKPIDAPGSP
ncbi:MAG: cytochrome b N-terminal domain-containing protein [Candidatus Dormibacteria bacterium]